MRKLLTVLFSLLTFNLSLLTFTSCDREPPLLLVDREIKVEFENSRVILDIDVLWEYELFYDWRTEWTYGWDEQDDYLFGKWEIQEPHTFNVRRYFTEDDPDAPHTSVLSSIVNGTRIQDKYKLGYYDILLWNDVETIDGVQSLHFDEETTLEYVTAYTNQASSHTSVPHHAPVDSQPYKPGYAFYQPEFLFAGDYDDLHVSDDPADYDSLIVETNTWYKFVPIIMTPVTYIYLTQVIIHNNNNRITGVDGSGNLTGLARSVNLKSHISSTQDISVNYPVRIKKHLAYNDTIHHREEDVDVIGGRTITFGLTGINPYQVTRASSSFQQIEDSPIPNFLEVNMLFYNGSDSTFVFDVTDQVKQRYKGGVITIHIDADEIPIPGIGGGSLFDAEIEDYEEETHEFDM